MTAVSLVTPAAPGFGERLWRINWGLVLVLTLIAGIGSVALYSAAGGHFEPWAAKHAMRYGIALGLMLVVALVHPKVWLSLAWPLYIASLLLLVAVDIAGKIGMGAQRWLVIGPPGTADQCGGARRQPASRRGFTIRRARRVAVAMLLRCRVEVVARSVRRRHRTTCEPGGTAHSWSTCRYGEVAGSGR